MKYYIFETQHRPDGEINVLDIVSRSTFAGALSYYHERISKMVASELYTSVDILLVDEHLQPVLNGHAHIEGGEVQQS